MDNEKDLLEDLSTPLPEQSIFGASKKSINIKTIVVVVVAIFLLVAGAAGAFFILTKSSGSKSATGDSNLVSNKSSASSPTNSEAVIAGYQTYQNDKLGIEFQYPESWIVEVLQTVPSDLPFIKIMPKGTPAVQVGIGADPPNSIVILVTSPMTIGSVTLSQSNIVQKMLVIDGHDAERLDYKPAGFFNSEVYIPFNDHTYEIAFTANPKSSNIEEFSQVFNKVLETIKFTNTVNFDSKEIASGAKQLKQNFFSGNEALLNAAASILANTSPSDWVVIRAKQLQIGLAVYFYDQKSFPFAPFGSNKNGINIDILTNQGFGPRVNTGTTTRYLGQLPSDDSFYYSCSESFYILQFNIPQDVVDIKTGVIKAGVNFLTPPNNIGSTFYFDGQQGLSKIPEQCLDVDKDGLSVYFETKYGADKNNPDTDSDGFLDGEEVKNGFNPSGPGKL